MIELASNGRIGDGAASQGVDPKGIKYPAVSSCITITCVNANGLAGIHLFRGNTQADTDTDLTAFAQLAGTATAVYLVGMITSGMWTTVNVRNRTGYAYDNPANGGTLVAKIRAVLNNYVGNVYVYDTSNLAGSVDLSAGLNQGAVSFFWAGGDNVGVIANANCTVLP